MTISDSGSLELAASDASDLADAKLILPLHPMTEPDGPGPHCAHCGQTHPPAGLADMSGGGPPVHECHDTEACNRTRDEREPAWVDHQFKGWRNLYARVIAAQQARVTFDQAKLERSREYGRELAQQRRFPAPVHMYEYEPEQAGLTSERFELALAAVRASVDARPHGDQLELSSSDPDPGIGAADTAGPAPFAMLPGDPWSHTMRNPANRAHTHGWLRANHRGVSDAASAMARRAVK